VALALLAARGEANRTLLVASLLGLAVLVVGVAIGVAGLVDERIARRIGHVVGLWVARARRVLRRPPALDGSAVAVSFRRQAIGLLRQRGARLGATMLAFYATQFVLLVAALRAVGVPAGDVTWAEILAAFSIAGLLAALPITPGGIGIVELGLAGALIAAGAPNTEAVAGALVFRAIITLVPLPLGAVTYVVWRCNSRWRNDAQIPPAIATA
jgi:putative heme transporter